MIFCLKEILSLDGIMASLAWLVPYNLKQMGKIESHAIQNLSFNTLHAMRSVQCETMIVEGIFSPSHLTFETGVF